MAAAVMRVDRLYASNGDSDHDVGVGGGFTRRKFMATFARRRHNQVSVRIYVNKIAIYTSLKA